MNLSDSKHYFVSGSSIAVYEKLTPSIRELVDSMRAVAIEIISTENIINEVIDVSNDDLESWYSYVVGSSPKSAVNSHQFSSTDYCLFSYHTHPHNI